MKLGFGRCSRIMKARLPLLAWLTLTCTTAAFGQLHRAPLASQDESMNFTLQGKITKLEAQRFVVSTQENIIFHVRHNDKTEIKNEDGSAASTKDLKLGCNVRVEGDLTESGEIVAKKIQIQHEEGPKSPPR